MTHHRFVRHRSFGSLVVVSAVCSTTLVIACAEDPPGLFDPVNGTGGSTGGSTGGTNVGEAGEETGGTMSATGGTGAGASGGKTGSGGSKATGGSTSGGSAGTHTQTSGGASNASGGSSGTGDDSGGMGGDDGAGGETDTGGVGGSSGAGGSAGGATGGTGNAGQGGTGTVSCLYHSAPVPPGQAGSGGTAGDSGGSGTGGSGGSGAPVYDINVKVSPSVGKYLANANGMTLYFRSSDLPGDCQDNNPPVSRCTQANAACSTTWPPFNGGARTLDPQLDDAAFGTIQRDDGTFQTTYFGWPLYTYVSDTAAGQTVGQGKAKVWHVAEIKLPNVVIMQEGTVKYLADGTGHTLYASSTDVLGTETTDPVSNCDATCLTSYEPFRAPRLYVVQSLEQDDFSLFVQPGGPLQVAYKGAPLYRARTDVQGGDQTGVTGTFALVLP
jgi:predicted lipoprotein with Yx(FWY)xxD motif